LICFTGRSDCSAAAPLSSIIVDMVVGFPGGPPSPPVEAGVGRGFLSLDAIDISGSFLAGCTGLGVLSSGGL
jgi:hypothetical protein